MEKHNINTMLPFTLADRRIDGECSGDYILPDTVADIKRVLRVTPKVTINGWYAENGRLSYEGKAVYTALIVTEEDKLVRVTYEEPFEDSAEVDGVSDRSIIIVRPECGALNWRMVNQRKLGIRMKLYTHISVSELRDIRPEYVSLKRQELECDEVTLPSMCVYGTSSEGVLSEDIELEGSMPQFSEIIDCRCDISVGEAKCTDGGIQCRGEAMVSILYIGEGGEPVFTVRRVPFMQQIRLDAAAADAHALAYVSCGEAKCEIKPNSYGEMRVLALDCDYTVYAECAVTSPVTLTRDVYSTERPIRTKTAEVKLCGLERAYSSNFSVNASISRAEAGAADAERVLDADVKVNITDPKCDGERGGRLTLEGNADITMTSLRRTDDGVNEYSTHTFTVPVKCEAGDSTGMADEMHFRCCPTVTMLRTRLDSSSLYCDFEVAVALFAVKEEIVTVIENAAAMPEEAEGEQAKKRDGSMILCYPSRSETLWDIAKRYRVTSESLAEVNGLAENERTHDYGIGRKYHVMLIPD